MTGSGVSGAGLVAPAGCWLPARGLSVATLFLPALLPIVLFWAWFGGYAAFTSFMTTQFKNPLAALGVHAVTFLGLNLVPKVMPFGLLRVGMDLLF